MTDTETRETYQSMAHLREIIRITVVLGHVPRPPGAVAEVAVAAAAESVVATVAA